MVRFTRLLCAAAGAFGAAALSHEGATADEVHAFGAARPDLMWARAVGDVDADPDEIDGISVDNAGNTVISGVFRNTLALADTRMTSRGQGDVFLASIAPDGRYRWTRQIGGEGDDNTYDLTTDAQGNIYASGWFTGDVDFGGTVLRSAGRMDQFVAKFSHSGDLLWARNFGGKQGDGGNEIAVLHNGDIAVSAITEGDFVVDGRSYGFGGGDRDSFVIRMTADGMVVWVAHAGGPGTERIRAISIAPTGDVYVGFQYRGSLQFGGKTSESGGGWDGALARLTPSGDVAWVIPVSGPGKEMVRGIAAAPDGSVYASGMFSRGASIAGQRIPKLGNNGDDYILKLSSDGRPLWIITLAGRGRGLGPELVADGRGVIASSLVEGRVQIRRDRDVVATLESPTGPPTSYLAAFDASGMPRFVYTPSPQGARSGALGDVLSVSRDGRYLAQAIRYRGEIGIGSARLTTPGERDSAVLLLRLNGS